MHRTIQYLRVYRVAQTELRLASNRRQLTWAALGPTSGRAPCKWLLFRTIDCTCSRSAKVYSHHVGSCAVSCHFSSFACGSMHVAFLCTALKVTVNLSGQGRAGQGRAGQGRAGQGRAGQGRAGQGRAGQGRAGQGRAAAMARACAFVFVVDDSVCIWMQGQEANPT